jgi:hypothetical protein
MIADSFVCFPLISLAQKVTRQAERSELENQ